MRTIFKIIGLFVLSVMVINAIDKTTRPPQTEEQKIATEKARKQWEYAVLAVDQLKQSMKNPASFELEQVLRMDDGTLCIKYHATNSFNAIVPGYAIIRQNRISAEGWNRYCADKSGEEFM
jgi:hypothetical protein